MYNYSFKTPVKKHKFVKGEVRKGNRIPYGYFSKYGNNCAVYGIKCISTNKQYVGATKHLQRRLLKHFSELGLSRHRNKQLQIDYNKYGFNDFEFIIYSVQQSNLLDKEREIQIKIGIDMLYNEKISGYYINPEYSKQLANSNKATHKTKEYRDKMSRLKTNRIGQYLFNGELIKEWDSAIQVCEKLGHTRSVILSACNGNKPHAYGYLWRYIDKNNNIISDGYAKGRIKFKI